MKLLVGWMAVAIIGSSINDEESPTDFDWKLNDNFFKIIAGLLILLLAFSLGNTAFQWIPASFAVISGGLVLAGLGLLQLGLSTQPSAFVVLRREAGKALVDNWLSISYSGFLSAGFSLIALLMLHMGVPKLSPWFFEYAVLICVHGIIRLLWLLKKLIQVIAKVDIAEQKKQMSI